MTSSKSLKAQKKPLKKTTKKKTLVKPKEKKILEQNNTVAKPKKASNLKVLPGTSLQVSIFIFSLFFFDEKGGLLDRLF